MLPEPGQPEPERRYSFRAVSEGDLPLLRRWLETPHVAEWWTDGTEASLASIREAMDSVSVEPLIVELDGRPIAYLQAYDPHLEDDHPYAELVGVGHGSAIIAQFAQDLFDEGAPRVIIDPDPKNHRAIRAYAKAGFRPLGERTSQYGRALLMALDAEEDD